MNRIKEVIAVCILASLMSVCVYAQDANVPTVLEIFDKRIELREKTKSIIIETETVTKFEYDRKGTLYRTSEARSDGFRVKAITRTWGSLGNGAPVKKEDAHVTIGVWDGNMKYKYMREKPSQPGQLLVYYDSKEKKLLYSKRKGLATPSNGYHRGETEKIEKIILNNSQEYKLRKKMQPVRGNKCYVIDANVKGKGTYTLWIDPKHDYHIARLKVQRKAGDYIGKNKLPAGDHSLETFEIISYQKVDGIWMPKKYMSSVGKVRYGNHRQEQIVTNVKKLILNPDHEKLNSFNKDDIPNGISAKFGTLPPSMSFIWKNGEFFDNNGNKADIDMIHSKYRIKK